MGKNSFISNFNKSDLLELLKLSRAFFVVVALLSVLGYCACKIGAFGQEGAKQVVRWKRQVAKTDEISKQAGSNDVVLFMGNSKISAGIIPRLFDHITDENVYSFNLGLPALPLGPHYFLLKDYLQHNPPPKCIVMALIPGKLKQGLFPYFSPVNAGFGEVMEYSFYRGDMYILVNYFCPLRYYWHEIEYYLKGITISLVSKAVLEHQRKIYVQHMKNEETFHHDWDALFYMQYFHLAESYRYREQLLEDNRGYYYIAEQAVIDGKLPDDYIPPNPPETQDWHDMNENDPFLKKFFDLARSKGIKIMLISDYGLVPETLQNQMIPDSWIWAKNNYPNVYYYRFGQRYFAPKYFSDPIHVNQAGAIKYTVQIAQEFKNLFY